MTRIFRYLIASMRRVTLAGLIALLFGIATRAEPPGLDAAFKRFWAADDERQAAELVDSIVRSGASFDDAYRRLKEGRPYSSQKAGIARMQNRTKDGVEHHFAVNVPEAYDPARKYQVRIHLHGGVMMRHDSVPPTTAGGIGALAGPPDAAQIYIVPFSWDASPWWSEDQILNLRAIVDRAKRVYNVDENRIVLSGVSDGGTGAYYVATRDTTPFAAFLPLNGHMMVLANNDLGIREALYPNNLRNKPFFIVNGTRDPLYPTRIVEPFIEHYRQGGVTLDYRPQDAGHNTSWWPLVRDVYEDFVRAHPRNPLPDTLTWETDGAPAHNRAHWLVIDTLGKAKDEAASLPDLNDFIGPPAPDFGARTIGSRINRIVRGSNAERIGLKEGDTVIRLNDEPVHVDADLSEAFEDLPPGATITLLVARKNAPVELAGKYEPQIVKPLPKQLFHRSQPSGRVDVTRSGNSVRATTRGVAAFTLLVSPDQFDFAKPIAIVANGRTVFNGRVQKDVRTLMKWAAADNDRTMLFGAELHVDLTR